MYMRGELVYTWKAVCHNPNSTYDIGKQIAILASAGATADEDSPVCLHAVPSSKLIFPSRPEDCESPNIER